MATVDIGIIINAVNRASPALRGAAKDVDNLGKSANRTTGQLRAFHAVVASIATGVVYQMSKSLIQAAGSLQMLNIKLANVTGSFDQANKTFSDLAMRFASAPFDLEQVAQGFTKLAAAGLDLDKTRKLTDALVNSVAAFGGTDQELERAFLGFSQVVGKGTLQMEELKQQISEAVPIATKLMASEAKMSVAEFTNAVAKGLISAQQAVDLFTAGAQKSVGNFAELMGFTISGSLKMVKTAFTVGLNDILQNTTFDERLTVIFRNVAAAVADFMRGIDENKVRSFFEWLRLVGNQAEKIIVIMMKVGAAIAGVFGVILKFIDTIPQDAIEFGLVGVFLFGRVGGKFARYVTVAGTTILTVLSKIGVETGKLLKSLEFGFSFGIIGLMFFGPLGAGIIALIATALHSIFADADQEAKRFVQKNGQLFEVTRGAGRVPGQLKKVTTQARDPSGAFEKTDSAAKSFTDTLIGTDAQLQKVIDSLNAMGGTVKIPKVDTTPFDKNADKIIKQSENIREKIGDVIRNVSDSLATLDREIVGDDLGEAIARINDAWGDRNDKLEDALAKATDLNAKTHQEGDEIQRIKDLMLHNDVSREKAITQQERLNELLRKQSLIQDQINRNQIQSQIDALSSQFDPLQNFLSQTEGSQVFNQVQQQRLDLSNQVLETESQILELNDKMLYEQDPQRLASLQKNIEMYQRLHDASIQALSQLSAEGVATQQFWAGIGGAMFNGVGNAIQSIIDGTFTWRDAMASVFKDLAQMAIQYIMKLLVIKTLEAAMGVPGGGTALASGGGASAGALGSFFPAFANGGAFNGQIKPFANGDILRGPTMFGLAGEAGNEAIMPLERIGGKLGVNATGQGGDNYSFTIQAIDTKSGVEFLMENMDHIVGGIRHRGRLNQGLARTF